MKHRYRWLVVGLLSACIASPSAAGDGRVVVTIKPLHSLVAGVMQGDGIPDILVDGAASEHDFVLRPSQMEMLQDADVVFYIGDDLETFLAESLNAIPQEVQVVSMQKMLGIELLSTRKAIRGDQPQGEEDGDHPQAASSWFGAGKASNTRSKSGGWSSSGIAPIPANSATAQLAQQWQDQQRKRYTAPAGAGAAGSGGSVASRNAQWLEQAAKGNYTSGSTQRATGDGASAASPVMNNAATNAYRPQPLPPSSQSGSQSISERQRAYRENGGYPLPSENGDVSDDGVLSAGEQGRARARPKREEHGDADHGDGRYDLHLWLNPENAKRMVDVIEATLSRRYPANKALYQQNADNVKARIDTQWRQLYAYLTPLRGKPFITFHDAYQYFETSYGLTSAGSISLHPGQAPGARRMAKLRDAIRDQNVQCVFAEPQYDDSVIASLTEGLPVKAGMLDPLGANLQNGPDLYFELNAQLAAQFADCLGK